jgi:hypothetical protein
MDFSDSRHPFPTNKLRFISPKHVERMEEEEMADPTVLNDTFWRISWSRRNIRKNKMLNETNTTSSKK